MNCRKCGACCIAPSISSFISGMPLGKPTGVRCINLDNNSKCMIFESSERPQVCVDYKPDKDYCGNNFEEAIEILSAIEKSI